MQDLYHQRYHYDEEPTEVIVLRRVQGPSLGFRFQVLGLYD